MTGYSAVMEALAHPQVKKHRNHWRAWREGRVPADWQLISWVVNENMLSRDGEDHTRLRKLVSQAFTPRRIERLRPRVAEVVDRLLEETRAAAERSGSGVVDVKAHLALPLPMIVISDLFGVEEERRAELHRLAGAFFDQEITPEQAAAVHERIQVFLAELVARRRAEPGDDMTSALIAAREEDEDRLSETELVWTLILIISAGYETTMNLITNAVRALLTHPGQLDLVVRGEASWEDVIEETLRWDSAAQNVPIRYTSAEVEIGGVTVPEGEALILSYGSAGRDPRLHGDDAHLFDVTRQDKTHVSFAHGRHYCLGANLARLEVGEALPRLFARFPQLELAVPERELAGLPSIVSNGVQSLPVRLGA